MRACLHRLQTLGVLALLVTAAAGCDARGAGVGFEYRTRADAAADPLVDAPTEDLSARPLWQRGEPLCIATFNVERLFDTICDSGRCGGSEYEALPTARDLAARAAELATAIVALDCEIVLLQEVESQRALDALDAGLGEHFREAILGETGQPASIDVGVLVNGAVLAVVSHADAVLLRPDGSVTSFARDFLEVHLALSEEGVANGTTEVIVFSAHFKSKSNDDPGRRLAEARAGHAIVVAAALANPDALVVLGGDLNDRPGSEPIGALEDSGDLLRVASDQSDEQVATYVFGGQLELIDHLFLALDGAGLYVAGSAESWHGEREFGFGGSDHAALRAEFVLE